MTGLTVAPDEVMLGALAREAVLLFAGGAATFLVPMLVVAVLVGLIQTIFSVQESSLSFLPKLAVLVLMIAIAGEGLMLGLGDYLESGLIAMVGAIH
ncbi:flagellar biosynthetic protein FliQ [Sandarakinorhabdus rubra]|uniref:flagellar biosynthetic protein FliQ n=1 Tax=Sandarakinorhabdus rubra TaxID=2672568 RepID=UPI0013DB03BD|nr:flagellar biosynthetic protein FliQ [Sandarakinorhabdus rubra]